MGLISCCRIWLGWRDSNPRMLVPETSALPLGDIPMLRQYIIRNWVSTTVSGTDAAVLDFLGALCRVCELTVDLKQEVSTDSEEDRSKDNTDNKSDNAQAQDCADND